MIVNFQQPAVGYTGDPPEPVVPEPVCLARGLAYRESISGIRQSIERSVQIKAAFRAATKTPLDRGGRLVNLTFNVTRSFATVEECTEFTVDHQAALDCFDGNGGLRFGVLTFDSEVEASDFVRELQTAVCQRVDFAQAGVSVVVTYNFLGSQWTVPEEEEP